MFTFLCQSFLSWQLIVLNGAIYISDVDVGTIAIQIIWTKSTSTDIFS